MNVENIIKQAVEELNEQREEKLSYNPETRLIGKNAEIDSMEFVTLVSIIEELISDEYDKSIRIVSDRAFSQERSPFHSIATLTTFVEELLKEAENQEAE